MRDLPSTELMDLLERLRLLSPTWVQSVSRQVRKLAGDLPRFDSVWLDALAQTGKLTAYQAREINAGRGGQLAIGPYLVRDRLPSLGYASAFLVREAGTQGRRQIATPADLTLLVARFDLTHDTGLSERLATLRDASQSIESPHFRAIREVGVERGRAWLIAESSQGIRAVDWIIENGRLPPLVVLHVARQMLVGLCELERLSLPHGDLHVRNLMFNRNGAVAMTLPGVRGALRPHEGFSMVDLPPECYESLSPERVMHGEPPSLSSDLFACGCVWWQMLTGRPAIAGGNALAKVKSAAEARIPDVRQLAPDAPPVLAEVIAACTSAKPGDRPRSFAEIARLLGPPSTDGAKTIAHCLKRPERWLLPRPRTKHKRGRVVQHALEVATVAACIFVMLAAWRLFVRPATLQTAKIPTSGRAGEGAMGGSPVNGLRRKSPSPPLPDSPTHHLASFVEPVAKTSTEPTPLRLPVGRVVRLASFSPAAGQLVCGENDARPTVVVPKGGLIVEQPDIRFQDVDFVAEDGSTSPMIVLRASTARFERCTFHCSSEPATRVAIAWRPASAAPADVWDAAVDHLSLINCVMRQVQTAIDRTRASEATIECVNLLHVSSGALVRIPLPAADAPVAISLDHCTLRETGPALEVSEPMTAGDRVGRITITATDCVLAVDRDHAVVELAANIAATNAGAVRWIGKDSLLEVQGRLLGSHDESGAFESLEASQLEVTGLVLSQLDFAGDQSERPEDSQLRRWLAPRKSLTPPGIVAGELPAAGVPPLGGH